MKKVGFFKCYDYSLEHFQPEVQSQHAEKFVTEALQSYTTVLYFESEMFFLEKEKLI